MSKVLSISLNDDDIGFNYTRYPKIRATYFDGGIIKCLTGKA